MKGFWSKPEVRLAVPMETERFKLDLLNRWQAFRLTYDWTRDSELMFNLVLSSAPRTKWQWYRQMWPPNNRTRFSHAIIPDGSSVPIGLHATRLFGYRSAMMYVALHDHAWRGKGVVLEVRARIMNHFFQNGNVERFYGEVHAGNMPSIANYKKLGFQQIGIQRRARQDPVTGNVFDMCLFEIFRDEWEKSSWAQVNTVKPEIPQTVF